MNFLHSWHTITNRPDEGISLYHTHNECEILYIAEGTVSMNIGGKHYTVGKDQLVIIGRMETHDLLPISLPYSRIGFHIRIDQLPSFHIPPQLISTLFYRDDKYCHLFDLKKEPLARRLIRDLEKEQLQKQDFAEEMAGILFHALLLSFYRIQPESFRSFPSGKYPYLEEARQYLELHFAEPIKIEALARTFHVTQSYFITKFREYTGCTPKRYLMLCRIAHAKRLLQETELPVEEIAYACGYPDSNGFVRNFRQQTEIPPGKFRVVSRRNSFAQ